MKRKNHFAASTLSGGVRRWAALVLLFFASALLAALAIPAGRAVAQDAGGLIADGDAAVSGFSGTAAKGGQAFINVDGASLKVFDLSAKGEARGQLVNAAAKLEVFARDIGQVFGVALDNADAPNIYVTATSAYGLHIVIPDSNGDGIPEVVKTGQAGAQFMDGQFGPGGGPGSIWKIDGKTGKASLLANLDNSGPGLGNIVFDPSHYQLFVSNLDSGLIHRLDLAGNVLGVFDHGKDGRAAAGLQPVEEDAANRADITSPGFDSDNSDTWGMADIRRRVWGMAYYKERLYYAVDAGPQIWSVGIKDDGGFAGDARVEIDSVPGGMPVSDILFTPEGRMIIAQRGGFLGSSDFLQFHTPGQNRVLRYEKDLSGQWTPQADEYAIGFPPVNRNASGGVGLSCENVLWSTGDNLRNDPSQAASLSQGGELVVHGLQGEDSKLVLPRNLPPWAAWFADYDGLFGDEQKAGHVGDVEVYRYCKNKEGGYDMEDSWPGWTPITDWAPPQGWAPPPWWGDTPDLDINKADTMCVADPVVPGAFLCTYTITVTNTGAAAYTGILNVTDNVPGNVEFVPPPGGSIPWACAQPGGVGAPIDCNSVNVETLVPGASETLILTVRRLAAFPNLVVRNCVTANVPGDPAGNNTDCGWAFPPGPDLEVVKTLNACVPAPGGSICNHWIDVTNTGNAPLTNVLHATDTLPAGSSFITIASASNPGWACAAAGGTVDCWLGPVTLNPGDTEWVEVSIFVPAGTPPGAQNCAALGQPEHVGDPDINGNNADCAPVLPAMAGPPLPLLFMRPLNCPAGWTRQADKWQPPKGWVARTVGKGKDAIVCGRKRPKRRARLNCPRGWRRYPAKSLVPAAWKVRTVSGGGRTIWCARPQAALGNPPPKPPVMAPPPLVAPPVVPACRPGEGMFHSPEDAPHGWAIRQVSLGGIIIWCGRKPHEEGPLSCGAGEHIFPSAQSVPRGWTSRRVSRGMRAIWCARPGEDEHVSICRPGERRFPGRANVPGGWRARRVASGGRVYWCATPGVAVNHCPKGTRYVRGHCVRQVVRCPHGTRLYRGKCVPHRVVRHCPRGTRLYRGKCVRRTVRHCPRGYKLKHGRCKRKHGGSSAAAAAAAIAIIGAIAIGSSHRHHKHHSHHSTCGKHGCY